MELRSRRGGLINVRNSFVARAVKRKMDDYSCTSEEQEVTEMKAACVAVEFPVDNILTGNFSPIDK